MPAPTATPPGGEAKAQGAGGGRAGGMGLLGLQQYMQAHVGVHLNGVVVQQGQLVATLPASGLVPVLSFVKDDPNTLFKQLTSIHGVDYLGHPTPQPARFAVVYQLLSHAHNLRLRLKVYCGTFPAAGVGSGLRAEADTQVLAELPTVSGLYPCANWYERETYDMYGIAFAGHPDLRRLLTDYGFVGFPLRKDFPLTGYTEVYYNAAEQRVAYKPVDLPQEFRHFDTVSPWRGVTGNAHLADEDNTFQADDFR